MRYLLDTHVLLWWLQADESQPAQFRDIIADPDSSLVVSAVSVAEIEIKRSIGKLTMADIYLTHLARARFTRLPFNQDHAIELGRLPLLHRDPFDRMLIAQARVENLVFLTQDPRCRAYDVRVL